MLRSPTGPQSGTLLASTTGLDCRSPHRTATNQARLGLGETDKHDQQSPTTCVRIVVHAALL
jgi:hypothetical protein